MKKVIFSLALIAAMLTACKNENKEAESAESPAMEASADIAMMNVSFGVRGNCEMCKTTIEKAANAVEGVAKANWDVDKKKIDVSYNPEEADLMAIHEAIAASGYDTEKVAGNEEAYNNLPQCCQYDHEMEMNQMMTAGDENHSMEGKHEGMEQHDQ